MLNIGYLILTLYRQRGRNIVYIVINCNDLLWATGLYDCGDIPDEKLIFKNHTWSKLEFYLHINKLRVHTLLSSNSMNIDISSIRVVYSIIVV